MKKNSGFTLIELMIVFAILAILIVVLLPNLRGARNTANDSAVETTLSRAAQAQEMFFTRCDNYYNGTDTCNTSDNGAEGESAAEVWTRLTWSSPTNITVDFTKAGSNLTDNYCVEASHSSAPTRVFSIRQGETPRVGSCQN